MGVDKIKFFLAKVAGLTMRLSFILPGLEANGGVRVTSALAQAIGRRSVETRVVVRAGGLGENMRRAARRLVMPADPDWLQSLRRHAVVYAQSPSELDWGCDEVAIAVGTYAVGELSGVPDHVRVLRYCHGFADHLPELVASAWSGDIPTLMVTERLRERLVSLGCENIIGTVENAICDRDFHAAGASSVSFRRGVGSVFAKASIKRPDLIRSTFDRVGDLGSVASSYSFGRDRNPHLGSVSYTCNPTTMQAREIYQACRVWFVASSNEGFGLPILEAMACGCAVVCSNFPAASELIVSGESGVLVPVDDTSGFAGAVIELFSNLTAVEKYSAAGREVVQRYSWARSAEKMLSILANEASGRGGAG